ncbi:DNA-binding transcriptional regulator, MarR family [Methylomagnum ishizawai]|uniref:DNA-binding transcriptional regulator, MarR family n=1 Tax=Methylomagnum ishizawai TaxID=1760988 RepID=A0A1Y6D419_9GAMM|nr:MarR family transcriptional regulator [Methylomagnum ishizawai]SMF97356.1 DNA-binding transcriptional regulator, MarR family [Methylomagnum ishizawai]
MDIDNGKQAGLSGQEEPVLWPHEALKRFRMIFRAVQQHTQWVESCTGVTCAQLWVMFEISRNPGLNVSELARVMAIHPSTVSNLLPRLEKKSLIRRERTPSDQRVVRLYLTETGQTLVDEAPDPKRGLLQHALFELSEPALKALTENLDGLVDAMRIPEDQAAMQPLAVRSTPPRKSGSVLNLDV